MKVQKGCAQAISPLLFGSFAEHIENCIAGGIVDAGSPLSDEKGIRQDVLDLCRELGPTVLRFPGGTVMGIYHWWDYIGPVEHRKKVKNIVWGGMMTREFGTAEYIQYCRAIGAQPMICVNMPTGTAEEAAAWVEYCNGTQDTHWANLRRSHGYDEPFRVKYWCIGNESHAEPDLGTQHEVKNYIQDAWEFTKYMKMTDPTIELVYVGHDEAWNRAVLDAFAPVCDYLSIHFYAGGEECFHQTRAFETGTLTEVETMLAEYNAKNTELNRWYRIPGRSHPIRIALDEWNIWDPSSPEGGKYGLQQTYTWRDALWTADFLIRMIRHSAGIGMANLAQIVNVIAPVMANASGSWKQPTFYPFAAFRKACGDTLTGTAEAEGVNAVLTEKAGRQVLLAVNTAGQTAQLHLPFEGGKALLLQGESLTAVCTCEKDCVSQSEMPCGSIFDLPEYTICIIEENIVE